jgi:dolichol-phosphate mannosyltransferase
MTSSPKGIPRKTSREIDRCSPVIGTEEIVVSVIIPTYREAENLPVLVPQITTALRSWPHEIIIVDDDSKDGTDLAVATLSEQGHAVRLINRTDQRGLSSAVLRGFFEAKGRVLVCMDADLSHPPEILPRMIETLKKDQAEFVIGSRYVTGGTTDANWSWFRKLNSRLATLMALPFCQVSDPLAGFFALPKAVLERAEALNPIGYKIGLELIVKCGCTHIVELPIHFKDRRFGRSKLGLREQMNYIRHIKRMADFKFGAWWQLGQFYIVGATGMIVDLLSYALLLRIGVALALARALAIFVSIAWNFMLNRHLSFALARKGRSIVDQYFRWLASTTVGAVISWSVAVGLSLSTKFFIEHVFVSAMLGIIAGSLTNFTLARYWVFTNSRQKNNG